MTISNIHFVGIKGVGMTSLAVILKESGMRVTGSDISEQFITDVTLNNAGITIFNGFSKENVNNAELVIYTGAHGGLENVEVKSAYEKGIRVISFAEGVGMMMDGTLLQKKLKGISIAGTHGKTTTTAMIATILSMNDLDPSYLIGTSEIPSLGNSGHYGKGEYFVVEADEYATDPKFDKRPKFMWHKPRVVVITNIEHDHPDIFPTLNSFMEAFRIFLVNLPSDCVVILNGDDKQVRKLLPEVKNRKITFGLNPENDVVISNCHTELDSVFTEISKPIRQPHSQLGSEHIGGQVRDDRKSYIFNLKTFGSNMGEFKINVPGVHNVFNATASAIASLETGLSIEEVKKGLEKFLGSKRRLEFKGKIYKDALLYDDYAHHPTEIRKTLKVLKELYPSKKITCIFQPHTYSRTKALFNDFASSFIDADYVILIDVFSSAREQPDSNVSSYLLSEEIQKTQKNVQFFPNTADVVKYLTDFSLGKDDIVITMGAGDVYKLGERLQVLSYKF